MSDLITLTCPSCGGRLEVTNEADRFVCAHCGNTHIIVPGVRVNSLTDEVERLKSTEKIQRAEYELESLLQQQRRAWQACGAAENRIALCRKRKLFGTFCCVAGIASILMGLATNASAVWLLGGVVLVAGLFYVAADDSEAQSAYQEYMRQISVLRGAVKQKQQQLLQYRSDTKN